MSDLFDKLKQGVSGVTNNLPQGKAGMLGAAGVGGLLGALFGGSKGIQRTAKNVAVVGGSAALAALAYKMYQNWSNGKQGQAAPQNMPQQGYGAPQSQGGFGGGLGGAQGGAYGGFGGSQGGFGSSGFGGAGDDPFAAYNSQQQAPDALMLQNDMGKLVLKAMIFAARADGHIDPSEQEVILNTAKSVTNDPNFNQLIRDYLNEPLDPKSLASQVSSRDQALDLYRLSAAAIVADNQAEQNYLSALAAALGLDGSTKLQLDQEAAQVRLQLAQQ